MWPFKREVRAAREPGDRDYLLAREAWRRLVELNAAAGEREGESYTSVWVEPTKVDDTWEYRLMVGKSKATERCVGTLTVEEADALTAGGASKRARREG